ncbi:Cytochrome C oxidase subunit IV [Bizionia echini]|uniref:Cytochrome C oxidase subunit IV n=1 Tax=Bizionia echini TaxID=649333 RepID=A0A1I4ZKT3_9FLAO|nr:cytochrome C oxidase subunit IV family protein [Bizionia echini]SFN50570.1 Cytochrome C oxidase subunit IV [Bizionia echini]
MKQKALLYVLMVLILLTVISAVISNLKIGNATDIIMILAALKFLVVAFYFMELRDAHIFWKLLLIGCLTIFTGLTIII